MWLPARLSVFRRLVIAIGTAAILGTAGDAHAQRLLGIVGNTVYRIDVAAQTVTALSPTLPFSGLTIGTIDPGGIYLLNMAFSDINLYRYTPGVGTTLVGQLGIDNSQNFLGISEGRDGFLYGAYGASLVRIDPLDPFGDTALLGPEEGDGANFYSGDIAADPATGIMYGNVSTGTHTFVTVDKTTGVQTPIGSSLFYGFGLAFARDGRLYASLGNNGALYEIDPMTGSFTFVMNTVAGMADLASELICGDGVIDSGETCDDGNITSGDGCSTACQEEPCFTCSGGPSTCTPLPNTTPCDDGTLCTTNDACLASVCVGSAAPSLGCKAPIAVKKSSLFLKNDVRNKKDQVNWKWGKGQATPRMDLGDPDLGTDYELCVYDSTPSVFFKATAPAGGTCAGKPCWKVDAKKVRYKDKELTPTGLHQVQLSASLVNGKAKAQVKGRGRFLGMPMLPVVQLPVTAQLRNSNGQCWTATFTTLKKNTYQQYKGQGQ